MKILVACEFSGIVRDAFINKRRKTPSFREGSSHKERSSGSFVRSSEREERPVYTECLLDLTGGRKDQGHFKELRMQWPINGPSKIGW